MVKEIKRRVRFSWYSFCGIIFAIIAGYIAINGLLEIIPMLIYALFKDDHGVHLKIAAILLGGVWMLSCFILLFMAYYVLVEVFKKKKD